MTRHDELVRQAVEQLGGRVVKNTGDGALAAFTSALPALEAALTAQLALRRKPMEDVGVLSVRMALHTGDAEERQGDYFGATVNRCARLLATAHGGQVLISLATEELVRDHLDDEVELVDLGEHTLRDLSRPERVFQLRHSALPSEFPPLRSLEAFLHNLPLQLTSFVGRGQELAEVTGLLAGARLVTLTGVGGSGKTRLALQMAVESLDDYPDGVWLVELAALGDPALIPQAIAGALGVREQPGRPLLDTLAEHLSRKELLGILDNCEHLLDASARVAESLLRAAPRLRVLATSREMLGVPGEVPYQVRSLATPDPAEVAPREEVTRYAAVRLFLERAEAARRGFRITEDNAPAVAQICWRLDGMPLAIELAAARLRGMSVKQVAERLDDRFRLLAGGSRTALPRQQTLRAAIDWSYELLSEPERALLRRVSVFRGGLTLEAAERVCAGGPLEESEILDTLLGLVDKSLVVVQHQEPESRYRLLETVRQYGWERLVEAGGASDTRSRHLEQFLDVAERGYRAVFGPEQVGWFGRLEKEHDNLRAALEWAIEGGDAERAQRLAGALVWFWTHQGYLSEGRRWAEAALSLAGFDVLTSTKSRALLSAGHLATMCGELQAGQAKLEESVRLFRDQGAVEEAAATLVSLGINMRWQARPERSRQLLEEALLLGGETPQATRAYAHLGPLARYEGNYQEAVRQHEEGLRLATRSGNSSMVALHRGGLGLAALRVGDLDRARSLLQESLRANRASGFKVLLAEDLVALAETELLAGEPSRVAQLVREGTGVCRDISADLVAAWALDVWARLAAGHGSLERAARLFGAVEAYGERSGHPLPPDLRRASEPVRAEVESRLGTEAYARAHAEGGAMNLDQALAYAMEE